MARKELGLVMLLMVVLVGTPAWIAAAIGDNAMQGQEGNIDRLDNAQLNAGGGGMPQTRRNVGWESDNPNVKEFG